ncbi:MAG TPA: cytochrome b/b6 domain-containing protein [Steroidobacteraceae bacterium]|nr:cytochrome b/b6 domain-containing protein [Steroidobacteraceae bacterium]
MTLDRDARQNRLHLAAVVLCAWLVLTSPWVSMLRRIPRGAGVLEWAHVVLGLAGLLVGILYTAACSRGGRWRLYFPWLAGDVRPAAHDFAGLFRGRLPSAEGGGLFAVIEGLLLLALLIVGVTGTAWILLQGSAEAVACRGAHIVAARVLVGLIVAHVLAVATHLVELA